MAHTIDRRKARLLKQRAQLVKKLPPLDEVLEGSLFKRRRRCGKASCRCSRGPGHLSWYLGTMVSPGQIAQTTLPDALLPQTRLWVGNYRSVRKLLKKISNINRQLIRLERAALKGGGTSA